MNTNNFPLRCVNNSGISCQFSETSLNNIVKYQNKWSVEELVAVIKVTNIYRNCKFIDWQTVVNEFPILKNKNWISCSTIYESELNPTLNRKPLRHEEIEELSKYKFQLRPMPWLDISKRLNRPCSLLQEAWETLPLQKDLVNAGTGSGSDSEKEFSNSEEEIPPVRLTRSMARAAEGAGAGAGAGVSTEKFSIDGIGVKPYGLRKFVQDSPKDKPINGKRKIDDDIASASIKQPNKKGKCTPIKDKNKTPASAPAIRPLSPATIRRALQSPVAIHNPSGQISAATIRLSLQ